MARIPDAFIDELLARSDIVEIVGARVPLKKQGREYSARCPFHDERSPSFTVSPTKQFYHCFGCGAHGTAISFLMNYDRLEFLDAVDELAKRAGLEVPRDTRQRNEDGDTRDVYSALDAASTFFRRQLAQNDKARAYVDKRGIDAGIVERFGIGYAPDGFSALRDALGTDPRRMQLLERAGLFSKNDRGNIYDKFRDRLMFPIHDRRGRVIAFGGRVIDPEDTPKYLNSPETALFHKGRELYGLWQAKQANTRLERLVVVEGYMDVVALAQYGVSQAVATLGTATTPEHAELLFRNAPDVYFCFDGDRAGRSAAWKALESVLPRMKDGRQALFLFLPEGEDPDTLVRKEGIAGFDAHLHAATPLSEFFFAHMSADVNLSSLDGKARLAERCKPLLAQIPDGAFGDLMQQRLVELTGVGARASAPQVHVPMQRPRGGPPSAQKPSLVRSAIQHLLHRPAIALELQPPDRYADARQPGIELLRELVQLVRERPDIGTGGLLEHFAGRDESAALQKLAAQELPGEEPALRAEFLGAIEQLEKQVLQQRIDELQQRMSELGEAEKYELRALLQSRLQR
ncbi:DNA primase [Pseudoluteimonas lycopersici]|uniref:DNA primase n=1 Tax=Pseudoluteimonas lycopersici TaxID=1324796 RepID=A0A516V5T7_9GAMM|nr:DNA primase [Lysobacter lycopersici]QDQ73886.1 DNA primase [Lysobacter lycopersici]